MGLRNEGVRSGPLRVLLVDPGGEAGGAEVLLESIARKADRNRAAPTVACLQPGSWAAEMAAGGLDVRVLRRLRLRHPIRAVNVILRLARIVRYEKMDLVHANGNSALLYASIAARVGGAKLVWHVHDTQSRVGARHRALLFILRFFRPDQLIFSSPTASSSWIQVWPDHNLPSCTILPDVDDGIADGDRTRACRQLGLAEAAPIVAMLARPVAYKGHEDLVRATVIIHERLPTVQVVMSTGWLGAGDFRDRLRRLADELGVGDAICLPPIVSATLKADLLAACSVLAHPAWTEPFRHCDA